MKLKKWLPYLILALVLVWYFLPGGTVSVPQSAPTSRPADALSLVTPAPKTPAAKETPDTIDKDGVYTSKEDVALYVHTYGRLPSNFVTKKEAEAAGWQGGPLDKVLPGKCIGGDYFGNYEGQLPRAKGQRRSDLLYPGSLRDFRAAVRLRRASVPPGRFDTIRQHLRALSVKSCKTLLRPVEESDIMSTNILGCSTGFCCRKGRSMVN